VHLEQGQQSYAKNSLDYQNLMNKTATANGTLVPLTKEQLSTEHIALFFQGLLL
jgi:hypothetical protein